MKPEEKRDLAADLAICEAATPGYWIVADGSYVVDGGDWDTGGDVVAECEREVDARFIAEARTGWPHAIKRAMAAEKALREWFDEIQSESYRADAAEYRATIAETEVERLRSLIRQMAAALMLRGGWAEGFELTEAMRDDR